MLILLAVLFLLLEFFVPSLRKLGKAQLGTYAVLIGFMAIIIGSIFTFLLYPKVTTLSAVSGINYDPNKIYLLENLSILLIGIIWVVAGLKFKKFMTKSDLNYYIFSTLLFLSVIGAMLIIVATTINPVYQITSQYK